MTLAWSADLDAGIDHYCTLSTHDHGIQIHLLDFRAGIEKL